MKKIIILLLTLVFAFSFVSCKKDKMPSGSEIKKQMKSDFNKAKKSLSFNDYKITFAV